jgi:hypothetical protein
MQARFIIAVDRTKKGVSRVGVKKNIIWLWASSALECASFHVGSYHNGPPAHVIVLSLIASSPPRHTKHVKPKTLF